MRPQSLIEIVSGNVRSMGLAVLVVLLSVGLKANSALASTDVWTNASGDSTWNTSSVDWLVNGTPGAFSNADTAIFNDTAGAGNFSISVPGTVSPTQAIVNAANDYSFTGTGGTIQTGDIIKLGTGSLTVSQGSGLAINTPQLFDLEGAILDGPNITSNTNLTLNMGNASFQFQGSSSEAIIEDVGGVQVDSGASKLTETHGAGFVTQVQLGSLARSLGGTIDFAVGAGNLMTTTNTNTNGIIGGYATVNGADWAVSNGNGIGSSITALSTYTNDTWAAGNNTTVTMSSVQPADSTTNSLQFNSSAGSYTVTLSDTLTNENTIQSGGILMTPNVAGQNNAITGGLLTSGNGSDLIVIQNDPNGSVNIGSQIADDGTTPIGLTVSGDGTVIASNPANTYSGATTINNAILSVNTLVNEGSGGGTACGLGQSGNGSANLVLNNGTLQYTGATTSTDRLLTLGPGGGTLDASGSGAITFAGNGVGAANAVAYSQDTDETLTLTGSNTGLNTLAPLIADPDATSQYATSLAKNGPGTWVLTNANTYSGGTMVNAGVLKVNNISGSGTGSGPVIVGATASLGGSGFIAGPTTIEQDGTLAPGDASNFTINNSLSLATGADLGYGLNIPNVVGTAGGNDLTTVNGNLNINTDLTVNVTPGSAFGAGTYTLIHYSSISDASNSFSGWNALVTSVPTSLAAGGFLNFSFLKDTAQSNVDLVVATGTTTPILGPGGSNSTVVVQPANQPINLANNNNPAAKIQIPAGNGNIGNGNGPNINFNFFLARPAAPAAKAFAIGWRPVIVPFLPMTPYFNVSPVVSATQTIVDPLTFASAAGVAGGWAYAGNIPTTLGAGINSGPLPAGAANVGLADGGIPYPAAQNNNFLAILGGLPAAYPGVVAAIPGNVWLPAFTIAPLIIVKDPPATPTPTYYGETFDAALAPVPIDPLSIHLAMVLDNGGIDALATSEDADPDGTDAAFDYQGSFLSLVDSDFSSITDLSQLTPAEMADFDGAFGVDPSTDTAWEIEDDPDATFSVVAIGLPEPASASLLAISGLALLKRRRRAA